MIEKAEQEEAEMFCVTRNDKRISNVIFEGRFLSVYCSINPIQELNFSFIASNSSKYFSLSNFPVATWEIIEIYIHLLGSLRMKRHAAAK